jgi:hypothetical protein
MGGEACAPSGRQRPGQAAAVGKVLGNVAGARPERLYKGQQERLG